MEAKMRRVIAGIGILLLAAICTAQNSREKKDGRAKPNLSGTWKLDEARSTINSGKVKITDYVLIIIHREPEFRMNKRFKQDNKEVSEELIFYTDGRPERSSLGRVDAETITRWWGRKLVKRLTTNRGINTVNRNLEFVTTEEWELSDDEKTLTRTIATTGPGMTLIKHKYVFNRVS